MPFGPDLVELVVHVDSDTVGQLGTAAQEEIIVSMPGCHHRPLTFKETAELTFDIGTEAWKTTIPINEYGDEVLEQMAAAMPRDTLRCNGREYHIVAGVRPHNDFSRPFKATIISEKHTG